MVGLAVDGSGVALAVGLEEGLWVIIGISDVSEVSVSSFGASSCSVPT